MRIQYTVILLGRSTSADCPGPGSTAGEVRVSPNAIVPESGLVGITVDCGKRKVEIEISKAEAAEISEAITRAILETSDSADPTAQLDKSAGRA